MRLYGLSINVVVGAITRISTNRAQPRAASLLRFRPMNLSDCDFHEPRRSSQRSDRDQGNRCRLAKRRLAFVRHQDPQADANGAARQKEKWTPRELFGSL